jgi:hypothetical protein
MDGSTVMRAYTWIQYSQPAARSRVCEYSDIPCTLGPPSPPSIFAKSAFRLAMCRFPSVLRWFIAAVQSGTDVKGYALV